MNKKAKWKKTTALLFLFLFIQLANSFSQPLHVSDNQRYLVKSDGKPFFWLGDTGWELFHRLNREEISYYLRNRSAKGFNVVQAVLLSEINGLSVPNAEGNLPLKNMNPETPNEEYFGLVDFVVERAEKYGIYMALLPSWGAHVEDKHHPLFENYHIFNEENAYKYGYWLASRYKAKWNIIWILGGDRSPEGNEKIWISMAKGIREGSDQKQLISYHPAGQTSSSDFFHNQPWLDFNMIQSGHAHLNNIEYDRIASVYSLTPPKPVLNGEPLYEEHVIGFKESNIRFTDYDVRKAAYWSVFAGAFGHTYGHGSIWQMYKKEFQPIGYAKSYYEDAMEAPGSYQMIHLKNLMESRPFLTRIPDQSIVLPTRNGEPVAGLQSDYKVATRDGTSGKLDASYIMVYVPMDGKIKINTSVIKGKTIRSWWYDPRNGLAYDNGINENTGVFVPSYESRIRLNQGGPDWILVIDDAEKQYPPPGKK